MAKQPAPNDEKARREARLALALRSNLKRRKSSVPSKAKPLKPPEPSA